MFQPRQPNPDEAGETGSPRNLASIAVDRLRSDIVHCVFKPGEKLRIQSLCERYGMNASAIREALSRLVTDELVEALDQKGFRVAPVSPSDLQDLTVARTDIECMALRQAMAIGDPKWEGRVVAAQHLLSRVPFPVPGLPQERAEWEAQHRNFHEALISGCNSKWIIGFCRLMYEQSERYRHLAEEKARPKGRDAEREHQDIVAAILDRDVERACQKLASHFQTTTALILEPQRPARASATANRRSARQAVRARRQLKRQ